MNLKQMSAAAALAMWIGPAHSYDTHAPDYYGTENYTAAFFFADSSGTLIPDDFEWDADSPYPLFEAPDGPTVTDITPAIGATGTVLEIFIPNFVDPLPLKKLRIQVTYEPGSSGLDPLVVGVTGVDDPAGTVPGILVDHVVDDEDPSDTLAYFYEDWVVYPNPDYELIELFVPFGVTLDEVIVDTVSTVPVPGALYLFASALALGGIKLRKRS